MLRENRKKGNLPPPLLFSIEYLKRRRKKNSRLKLSHVEKSNKWRHYRQTPFGGKKLKKTKKSRTYTSWLMWPQFKELGWWSTAQLPVACVKMPLFLIILYNSPTVGNMYSKFEDEASLMNVTDWPLRRDHSQLAQKTTKRKLKLRPSKLDLDIVRVSKKLKTK